MEGVEVVVRTSGRSNDDCMARTPDALASPEAQPMLELYFNALGEIMAAESRMMANLYRHRGKLGENRAALLQRFLATYLPQRFGVGAGFALFGDDVSTEQDVVVYDQLNNPVLFPETVAPLFPPSALAAVVEVKSRLTKSELRQTIIKGKALKENLRGSFIHHPAPPRAEALAALFAFDSRLAVADVLHEAKAVEEEIGAEMGDRIDAVCVLGEGLVLGGSLLYSTTHKGEPLHPETRPPRQQRLAVEAENSLFIFYSRLLDYILARAEVRPQLMSYLPPDTPLGEVVASG